MSILFLTPVEGVSHRAAIYLASIILVSSDFERFVIRGTQREYSSKPLKHRIVERILVVKR